jgi:hypothetical protein
MWFTILKTKLVSVSKPDVTTESFTRTRPPKTNCNQEVKNIVDKYTAINSKEKLEELLFNGIDVPTVLSERITALRVVKNPAPIQTGKMVGAFHYILQLSVAVGVKRITPKYVDLVKFYIKGKYNYVPEPVACELLKLLGEEHYNIYTIKGGKVIPTDRILTREGWAIKTTKPDISPFIYENRTGFSIASRPRHEVMVAADFTYRLTQIGVNIIANVKLKLYNNEFPEGDEPPTDRLRSDFKKILNNIDTIRRSLI